MDTSTSSSQASTSSTDVELVDCNREELEKAYGLLREVRSRYQRQTTDLSTLRNSLRTKHQLFLNRSDSVEIPRTIRPDYAVMAAVVGRMVEAFDEELSPMLSRQKEATRVRQSTNRLKASKVARDRRAGKKVEVPEDVLAAYKGPTETERQNTLVETLKDGGKKRCIDIDDIDTEVNTTNKKAKVDGIYIHRPELPTLAQPVKINNMPSIGRPNMMTPLATPSVKGKEESGAVIMCDKVRERRPRSVPSYDWGTPGLRDAVDSQQPTETQRAQRELSRASVSLDEMKDGSEVRLNYAMSLLTNGREETKQTLGPCDLLKLTKREKNIGSDDSDDDDDSDDSDDDESSGKEEEEEEEVGAGAQHDLDLELELQMGMSMVKELRDSC